MKTVFGSEIINFIRIIKDIKGDKIDKGNNKNHISMLITVSGPTWLFKVI